MQVFLQDHFPGLSIKVVNRGVNGEEADDMLARFDSQVLAEKPDLVLWQIGTNALLRERTIGSMAPLIRKGIERIRASGADLVLIDPQYVPAVIARRQARSMVDLIAAEATREGTGLFPRFELMRAWHDSEQLPFEAFVSPDALHMNDRGYDCFARQLASAIAENVSRRTITVASRSATQ